MGLDGRRRERRVVVVCACKLEACFRRSRVGKEGSDVGAEAGAFGNGGRLSQRRSSSEKSEEKSPSSCWLSSYRRSFRRLIRARCWRRVLWVACLRVWTFMLDAECSRRSRRSRAYSIF